jgi:hypothetical protein
MGGAITGMNTNISSYSETRELKREHKGFQLSKYNLHEGADVVILNLRFVLCFRRYVFTIDTKGTYLN